MLSQLLHYGLLIALAIAVLFAAYTDIRRREIDNWLNLAILVAAPAFWWASGMTLWPEVTMQVGFAAIVIVILLALYALNLMGGGDLKLLAALSFWIAPAAFAELLIIMALVGGGLAIIFIGRKILLSIKEPQKLPYGVAIASGVLWVLAKPILAFGAQASGSV